jgi:hypothetical protein
VYGESALVSASTISAHRRIRASLILASLPGRKTGQTSIAAGKLDCQFRKIEAPPPA